MPKCQNGVVGLLCHVIKFREKIIYCNNSSEKSWYLTRRQVMLAIKPFKYSSSSDFLRVFGNSIWHLFPRGERHRRSTCKFFILISSSWPRYCKEMESLNISKLNLSSVRSHTSRENVPKVEMDAKVDSHVRASMCQLLQFITMHQAIYPFVCSNSTLKSVYTQ